MSRHWYDIVRLDESGIVNNAISNRELALSVASHKAVFFPAKDTSGDYINYKAAVQGEMHLVPSGIAYETLANDFVDMIAEGMLFGKNESFHELMEHCKLIEDKINCSHS